MKTDLIFIIQGYKTMSEAGHLEDVVSIELIDRDVESALKRAKKLIKKNGYRVANIIEKIHASNN